MTGDGGEVDQRKDVGVGGNIFHVSGDIYPRPRRGRFWFIPGFVSVGDTGPRGCELLLCGKSILSLLQTPSGTSLRPVSPEDTKGDVPRGQNWSPVKDKTGQGRGYREVEGTSGSERGEGRPRSLTFTGVRLRVRPGPSRGRGRGRLVPPFPLGPPNRDP